MRDYQAWAFCVQELPTFSPALPSTHEGNTTQSGWVTWLGDNCGLKTQLCVAKSLYAF